MRFCFSYFDLPPWWENKKPTAGVGDGLEIVSVSLVFRSPTANGAFAGDMTPRGGALRHGRQRRCDGVGNETVHIIESNALYPSESNGQLICCQPLWKPAPEVSYISGIEIWSL